MIHRDKLGHFCSKKNAAKTTKKVAKKAAAKTTKKAAKKVVEKAPAKETTAKKTCKCCKKSK